MEISEQLESCSKKNNKFLYLDMIYMWILLHIYVYFFVAENHRLQSAYDNYLITKLVVVSPVSNATLTSFYVSNTFLC